MTDATDTPAGYNEPAPGAYSTEEHLKAQQEQTSASNGEPLHPELSPDSDLSDPAEVGQLPPVPVDTAPTAPNTESTDTKGDKSK